jgi:hypothetical protein
MWTDSLGTFYDLVEGSCEHDNEHSSSLRRGNTLIRRDNITLPRRILLLAV